MQGSEREKLSVELTNVPEDINAMLDAVSRTQVRAKVIPSQTTEVSFKVIIADMHRFAEP